MASHDARHGALLRVRSLTAAGSTQSDATLIPLSVAVVVATGDSLVGLRLPPASKDTVFFIINNGSGAFGTLNVYPATGDAINALSANTAISMASLSAAMFVAASSSLWYTVPRIPS